MGHGGILRLGGLRRRGRDARNVGAPDPRVKPGLACPALGEPFGYDEAVIALRGALVETTAQARAFAIRARGRPALISARSWAELAEIEALLARDIQDCLRLELHVDPWPMMVRIRAGLRGLSTALAPEPRLLERLLPDSSQHPVEQWRQAAPQLEASLWPLFVSRTQHLANAAALALNEPHPYPALFWHAARREFRR